MTKEEMEAYGRQLQCLRERQRLTRDEVGLALGYTKTSARNVIGRWERGERLPHIYQIPVLMKLYHVSASDIMPRVAVEIPPRVPPRESEHRTLKPRRWWTY